MICVIWGEDKSTKNTFALSFPKPLVNMEFDIGGFQRSCRNLPHAPIKDWYDQGLIKLEQYVMPFQFTMEDLNNTRNTKLVIGMKELWYKFASAFLKHLNDPNIQTIMVDTGTILYDVTCQAFLQEMQEKQVPLKPDGMGRDGKPLRVKLQKQEYTEPNSRMRGFAYQAKANNKHLVVTHHAADEYGMVKTRDGMVIDRTGKRVMHGWKRWGDSADVLGYIAWNPTHVDPATNTTSPQSEFHVEVAEVQELRDMVFNNPTYDMVNNFITMVRGE